MHVTDDFELYTRFSVILLFFFAVDIVFLKIEKSNIIQKKRKKKRTSLWQDIHEILQAILKVFKNGSTGDNKE